jgi:hypothetical protein
MELIPALESSEFVKFATYEDIIEKLRSGANPEAGDGCFGAGPVGAIAFPL